MDDKERYPIGQQDFKTLRERGALYVDKTGFVDRIVRSNTQYYFLARPRRFGKSLFLSTLRYFFEGRRELFKGLYIGSTDWDWQSYPVLYLDLNTDRFAEPDVLDSVLDRLLRSWEERYCVDVRDTALSQRFKTIIEAAHARTGRQVVILVDEYDKPLVGNVSKNQNFEHYRTQLASIYSNFKSAAEHIRLVFLTGVSRFSKLSVFSDLNNLKDISFSNDYADICGITERELLDNFKEGIAALAAEYGIDSQEACSLLKRNYDGYRFAKKGSDIYNPWSLINCMAERDILNYWNATGAASIVAEALYRSEVDIEKTLNASWSIEDLAGLDLLSSDPTAMLYQAGYLTIGAYDRQTNRVTLKVPNEEVSKGLFQDLMNLYVRTKKGRTARSVIDSITDSIRSGEPERLMRELDAYFASIPYDLRIDNENNFHNALYVLMTLIGLNARAEVHTSDGRIDLLVETPAYVYIIELKHNGTAEQALRQIEVKEYARRFANDHRRVFCIGVNFSTCTRRIESWKIK